MSDRDPVVPQPPQPAARTFSASIGRTTFAGSFASVSGQVAFWLPQALEGTYVVGQRVTVIVHPPDPPEPEPTPEWESLGMWDGGSVDPYWTVGRDGVCIDAEQWGAAWRVEILPGPGTTWETVGTYPNERAAFDACAFLLDSAAGGAVPVDPAEQDAANREQR
jgi:hypothetical protein